MVIGSAYTAILIGVLTYVLISTHRLSKQLADANRRLDQLARELKDANERLNTLARSS